MKKIRKTMATLIVAVLTMMLMPASVFADYGYLGVLTVHLAFSGIPDGNYVRVSLKKGPDSFASGVFNNDSTPTINDVDGSEVYVSPVTIEAAQAALPYYDIVRVDNIDGYDKTVTVIVNSLDGSTHNADVTYNIAFTESEGSGDEPVVTPTPTTNGKITISNASAGKTYEAYKIPFLTVQKVKKAEKRDTYAKKRIVSFLPRFPKLS